jgi:hypothetical protein
MIRESIIRRIVELDLAGHSLLEENVRASDELLHAAAVSEFGLWETALGYAGISARDVGRCRDLSPERIKHRLRRLCTTGYDLGAMVNRSRDRGFYEAAVRHFGCWRDALTAAGINLANVPHRRPKHLDRETMILWLQQRQAAGQNLIWTDVCLENRDYATAIRRTFHSWTNAMAAAGVQSAKLPHSAPKLGARRDRGGEWQTGGTNKTTPPATVCGRCFT